MMTVSDLGECSAVDVNNNEVVMAIPVADAGAGAASGVIFDAANHTTSEWVFMGVILALSVAVAVLWIEYKRLKNKTLRNLLSQGWMLCFVLLALDINWHNISKNSPKIHFNLEFSIAVTREESVHKFSPLPLKIAQITDILFLWFSFWQQVSNTYNFEVLISNN